MHEVLSFSFPFIVRFLGVEVSTVTNTDYCIRGTYSKVDNSIRTSSSTTISQRHPTTGMLPEYICV